MKKTTVSSLCLLLLLSAAANTYYSTNNSSPNGTSSWHTNLTACGNNATINNYSSLDAFAPGGTLFYRIKAIDKDGRFIYSGIVRINTASQQATELRLYPNPVLDKRINIEAMNLPRGAYELRIIDRNGNIVYRKSLDHPGGNISQQLQLPVLFAAGVYSLSLSNNNEIKLARAFMLQ